MTDQPADDADHPADCRCAGCEGIGLGFFTGIATDPPAAAITAARDALAAHPGLGLTLAAEIYARVALEAAAPHITAAATAAERQRCAQVALAESLRLTSNISLADANFDTARAAAKALREFADLLREDTP